MKNKCLLLFVLLFNTLLGFSQHISLSKDNICDEKCIVRSEVISYIEYTGTDFNNKNVREEKIKISGKKKKWVKKKDDANCKAPNPDDCLIWCLEETPSEYFRTYIVIDTTDFKEFKLRSFVKSNIGSEDTIQFLPVICKGAMPLELIDQVTKVLVADEYLDKYKVYKKINIQIRKALEFYQEDYDLPIGHLNLKTLDHMKIKYIIE